MHDQATRMREIARLYAESRRPVRPCVLTVTSGKGGVGKSTLALNLAIALVELGKRVVLLDADANLAGLDVMAGISPRFRLSHVLRGERDLEEVIVTPYPGLRLVPGNSGDSDYPGLESERQHELIGELTSLEERADVLLIDTGAGINPEIITYAAAADVTLVVTSIEPTAVMDAYAMIKVLSLEAPLLPVEVVVNTARTPREGEEAFGKLQAAVRHFLKRELLCASIVPRDDRAREALLRQEPLVKAFPRSAAALSIQSLARVVVRDHLQGSVKRMVAL
jgi:flagellar biosynthesis protein FlhG